MLTGSTDMILTSHVLLYKPLILFLDISERNARLHKQNNVDIMYFLR